MFVLSSTLLYSALSASAMYIRYYDFFGRIRIAFLEYTTKLKNIDRFLSPRWSVVLPLFVRRTANRRRLTSAIAHARKKAEKDFGEDFEDPAEILQAGAILSFCSSSGRTLGLTSSLT